MSRELIPPDWSVEKIKNVADVRNGGTPSRANPAFWIGGNIPWATPTDITSNTSRVLVETKEKITKLGLDNSAANLLPVGSLLITSRATLGEVRVSGLPITTNQGFKNLVLKNNIDKWFLYYQLCREKEKFSALGKGSTFLEINKKDTENFDFPFAPFPEQQKIAEILSTLDDLILIIQTQIKKNKLILKGLLHDLFASGVDENGNLRSLNSGNMVGFIESKLGFIPRNWKIKTLIQAIGGPSNNIVAGPFGSSLKVSDYQDAGVPILRLQNIGEIDFLEKDIKYISPKKAKSLQYHAFESGDLCLAKLGDPIGKTCIIPDNFNKGIVVSDVVRIRVDTSQFDKIFLLFLLNDEICRKQLYLDIIGTTRPRVNLSQVRNILLPCPPLHEQNAISLILQSHYSCILNLSALFNKFILIKQGLMQDLLTGKVRVTSLL